ncbi:hypothetical protein PHMEG_0006509, partial [Phytophthora megakarya]
KKSNEVLGSIDGKGRSKTARSLRKRWRKLRADYRPAYDVLCLAFITRKANGDIVDRCTPDSHQWKPKTWSRSITLVLTLNTFLFIQQTQ